jgi:hypothetical protein
MGDYEDEGPADDYGGDDFAEVGAQWLRAPPRLPPAATIRAAGGGGQQPAATGLSFSAARTPSHMQRTLFSRKWPQLLAVYAHPRPLRVR